MTHDMSAHREVSPTVKITTGMIAVLCFTVLGLLALIGGLIALGKDPTQVVTAFGGIVIPTVITLAGYFKSSKAADSAAQAVHNTNGRLGELIGGYIAAGIPVPPGYEDVTPVIPSQRGDHVA